MPAICASIEISRLRAKSVRSYGVLTVRRSVKIPCRIGDVEADEALANLSRELEWRRQRVAEVLAVLERDTHAAPSCRQRVEESRGLHGVDGP